MYDLHTVTHTSHSPHILVTTEDHRIEKSHNPSTFVYTQGSSTAEWAKRVLIVLYLHISVLMRAYVDHCKIRFP